MKNFYTILIATAFTVSFLTWLTNYKQNKLESNNQSLFESPDDPEGANTYDFYRLRNPATGLVPYHARENEIAFAATLPQRGEGSRSLQWQNRGPYNLGGRTRAIALDVTNENTILAGQVTGGMWRSDDGGASFTQTTQPAQLHSTTCIAQDKRSGHTNTWYYGTGEEYAIVNFAGYSSQFAGDGIFKSTDGGHSWSQLSSTTSPNRPNPFYPTRGFDFVWQMVTDPVDTTNDIVYAAVVNGIWRSADGGNTWMPVLGLDTTVSTVSLYSDIVVTSTGVLYAALSSESPSKGIYRSTDGITWTNITPTGFATSYERIEIGIAPSDENQVYIIAQTPGNGATGHSIWHYHYLSGNGSGAGGRWTNRNNNVPDDHCEPFFTIDFKKYNSQSSYDMFIAVHPTDTNIVFLGGTDLYRSTTGFGTYGYSWIGGYQCDTADLANYIYPNHHPDQHRLIFSPSNPHVAYSASDGGLRKTNDILADTVVWQTMNNGYNTGQFYACAVEPGNTNSQIIIGGLQDNGSFFTGTSDYTQPWSMVFEGDGGNCFITHGRGNYYMSFQQGKIFKMDVSDNGTVNNYTRIDPTGGAGNGYLFVTPYLLDPTNDSILYLAAADQIWRNDSLPAIPMTENIYNTISQGWHLLPGTKTSGGLYPPNVSALAISEANPDLLFYGTDNGLVYKLDSCHSSNTSVKVNISGSNFPVDAYISCVEVDRLNPNNLMVTFSNYGVISIFYTNNGGQTWTDVAGNLEENPDGSGNGPSVTWAKIYNDGTNVRYYAATSIGLFSTDSMNGLNTVWQQEGASNIGNVVVDMVIARTYDSLVVVATHGNGIYTNKIVTPSAISEVKNTALPLNCYPNPFNNSVTIDFGADNVTDAEVQIYDLTGKLLRMLKTKNARQLIWDGTTGSGQPCSNGTYIIKAIVNGRSGWKKVVKM